MKKNLFKKFIFTLFLFVLIMYVAFIMLKYDVEGEKELPFSISKILVVSTVDGDVVDDPNNIWNVKVTQVNDLYFYIDKTTPSANEVIKEIKFENFVVEKNPQVGNIKLLRPTGELKNLYDLSTQDYLNSDITYYGGQIDDMKSLEISNTGGILGFRFAVEDLGDYISNEDNEITYDGKLLSNLNISVEQIKFSVKMDVIITTSNDISYKGNIILDLPIEDIIEKGSSNVEITDFSNVIFKRV